MPRVSSNHLRESGKPPSASSARSSKTSRPGWPEIIVGLVVYLIVGFGGVSLFKQLGLLTPWRGAALPRHRHQRPAALRSVRWGRG
ncbi:hypothetical protein [Allocoleopsis franciscana]|uniref:hypothetical protein n=1 Tax=Allocoleopsis franciscana TaxID=2886352 RepID=UPI001C110F8C|nr:hypothetical protein [Allocoleopsis franciscana]